MKYLCILSAVIFSSLTFCANDSPTELSAIDDYSDSIVIDLFSYNVYNFQHNTIYYDSVIVTAKGQSLLKPLDSVFKDYGNNFNAVIVPKYKPSKFEAWIYDSIPLIRSEETDPDLLVKVYSMSMFYFLKVDTSSMNPEKCIKPVEINYLYDQGCFMIDKLINTWGIGKVKIYYKQ